ncbi:hypothetical protein [Candidatus Nitrosacidococcus tergens]|uniref:Bulb-type lectin domain-containing protein n=1 Tax=Candidatus Nitrosacidococcus tergens TaxID=553981 RepID=A0A7G1QBH1_9GAMM|nr:hypothetical protein [Candidatus Nitrosacidococcus tergens]CAB1277417.1 conserved exported protein of unknown function [Candidatus Nitrosacidococcus tergens]
MKIIYKLIFSIFFLFLTKYAIAASPENGWWWNSDQSGIGYSIETQDNTLFVTTFTYDSKGNPIWYSGSGLLSNDITTINLLQSIGGSCFTCAYTAAITSDSGMEINFSFTDSGHGNATVDNQTIPIERFNFGYEENDLRIIGNWTISAPFINRSNDIYGFSSVVSYIPSSDSVIGKSISGSSQLFITKENSDVFITTLPISNQENLVAAFIFNGLNEIQGKAVILDSGATEQEMGNALNQDGTLLIGFRNNLIINTPSDQSSSMSLITNSQVDTAIKNIDFSVTP